LLLCTCPRWELATTTVITAIEATGLLNPPDLDELAESFLNDNVTVSYSMAWLSPDSVVSSTPQAASTNRSGANWSGEACGQGRAPSGWLPWSGCASWTAWKRPADARSFRP